MCPTDQGKSQLENFDNLTKEIQLSTLFNGTYFRVSPFCTYLLYDHIKFGYSVLICPVFRGNVPVPTSLCKISDQTLQRHVLTFTTINFVDNFLGNDYLLHGGLRRFSLTSIVSLRMSSFPYVSNFLFSRLYQFQHLVFSKDQLFSVLQFDPSLTSTS